MKVALLNRRALALTIFVSLFLLVFLPDTFAVPFYKFFGFYGYFLHSPRESVLVQLCSLEGEQGYGLPLLVGNVVYLLTLPAIIYVMLALGFWLWQSSKRTS